MWCRVSADGHGHDYGRGRGLSRHLSQGLDLDFESGVGAVPVRAMQQLGMGTASCGERLVFVSV